MSVSQIEYQVYVYEAFTFERPIYQYVWEIIVILSLIVCVLFITTLLRKKLRSVTSYILCAISVSDGLTGLVTLPTYIMVYHKLETPESGSYAESGYYDYNMAANYSSGIHEQYLSHYSYHEYNQTGELTQDGDPLASKDAYFLSKGLCVAFMISKFFLSKLFHTLSIWLTVFLGTQRCLSVLLPFTAPQWFSKTKTIVICVLIVLLALTIHGFHLFNDKTTDGFCAWFVMEDCSDGSCVQLWVELILVHIVPCIILTIATVIMSLKLLRSTFHAMRIKSMKKFRRGKEVGEENENRQVSLIVLVVMVVFLVTELPYGCFLFYVSIVTLPDVAINRKLHVVYELTMVLAFNANLIIYLTCNRRFRTEICRIFSCCKPVPEVRTITPNQTADTELSTMMTNECR